MDYVRTAGVGMMSLTMNGMTVGYYAKNIDSLAGATYMEQSTDSVS